MVIAGLQVRMGRLLRGASSSTIRMLTKVSALKRRLIRYVYSLVSSKDEIPQLYSPESGMSCALSTRLLATQLCHGGEGAGATADRT